MKASGLSLLETPDEIGRLQGGMAVDSWKHQKEEEGKRRGGVGGEIGPPPWDVGGRQSRAEWQGGS